MPRPSRTPKQDATARAFTPPSSLDHEALVALAERRAARLQMLRETGSHPVVLREQVTSPGGTTAAALRELEVHKVRAAFLAAMEAARDRSAELAAGD